MLLPEPEACFSDAERASAFDVLFGRVFFLWRRESMVHFVGAGPGAPDLITLRGAELLAQADQVIYAGSLVNRVLLERCRPEIIKSLSALKSDFRSPQAADARRPASYMPTILQTRQN